MHKGFKYALLAAALYEFVIGVSELLWVSTGNKTLATLAGYPSAASVIDTAIVSSAPASAHNIEGAIDIAIAALAAYVATRKG